MSGADGRQVCKLCNSFYTQHRLRNYNFSLPRDKTNMHHLTCPFCAEIFTSSRLQTQENFSRLCAIGKSSIQLSDIFIVSTFVEVIRRKIYTICVINVLLLIHTLICKRELLYFIKLDSIKWTKFEAFYLEPVNNGRQSYTFRNLMCVIRCQIIDVLLRWFC